MPKIKFSKRLSIKGSTEETSVSSCGECHALVLVPDQDAHREWHATLERTVKHLQEDIDRNEPVY